VVVESGGQLAGLVAEKRVIDEEWDILIDGSGWDWLFSL